MCTHLILLNLVREIGFDRWVSIAYAEWFRKVVLDKWILSSLIKDPLNPILWILQIHIIKVWYTNLNDKEFCELQDIVKKAKTT